MAGLLLCVLVAGGLLAWSAADDDRYVAPTPSVADRPEVDPAAAAATLAAFEDAVRAGDADAARALAPAGDEAAADLLAGLVDNAARARVDDFTLRYVDDEGAPAADGAWTAAVDATWRFRGFDRTTAAAEVRARLVEEGDRVALAGFGDSGGSGGLEPVWLSGPVEVRRTPQTLVLVDGSAADADRYATRAAAAVPTVRRVLPGWRRGLVVEVPASSRALERAVGGEPGSYDQIAAVTTSADGSRVPDAPVHVFANPDVYDGLRRTGAQVVMSHEATHVATGAWNSSTPLWLLEGFADYVALRDTGLPVERAAAQAIRDARRSGPPRSLPDAAAFGTSTPRLGATYEAAWLAVRRIAKQAGEPALVRFYLAADRGRPLERALPATTGLTLARLTADWRAELMELAR